MITKSILNPDLFKVLDEASNVIYYGCSQEWYNTSWQRRSGCGPTVTSNIFLYINDSRNNIQLGETLYRKKDCLSLMEEIWGYVTPTKEGIPTTKMLYDKVLAYTKSKGIDIESAFCDLAEDKAKRPDLSEILNFLEGALLKDIPIAFLNLCNGDEKNLEGWHWVTIISLEYTEDRQNIFVNILDEGLIKKIDLVLWYNTTIRGGGFVYFTASPSIDDRH